MTLVCLLLFFLRARPELRADESCKPLGWLPTEWVGLCPDAALPGHDEGWLPLLTVIGRRLFPFKKLTAVVCLWFIFCVLYHRYTGVEKHSSAWAPAPSALEMTLSQGQQPEPLQRFPGQGCLGKPTVCSLTQILTEDQLMAVLAVPGGSTKTLGPVLRTWVQVTVIMLPCAKCSFGDGVFSYYGLFVVLFMVAIC